jgi:hypothetical protein
MKTDISAILFNQLKACNYWQWQQHVWAAVQQERKNKDLHDELGK